VGSAEVQARGPSSAKEETVKTNVKDIETYQDAEGQFRWRAKAKNGEIVAQGESHTRRRDAKRAAQDVFPGIPIKKVKEESTDGNEAENEAAAEAAVQAVRLEV